MEKLIITAAICGAEIFKEQTKYIPYTIEEIANEAKKCVENGASVIHLHVRKDNGEPTQDIEIFKEAISAINSVCKEKPIINVSTGGAIGMSIEERIQPVYLKPEIATLDIGTMNFGEEIFVNDLETMVEFAKIMKKEGVKAEFEIFDTSGIEQSKYLIKKKLVKKPYLYNLVFGVFGGMPASLKQLIHIVDLLPKNSVWTASGIGKNQLKINIGALIMGGHVRTGLEDNIYYSKGRLAKGSYELVKRIFRLAKEYGREVATPDEARKIMGLENGKEKT